nr:hypothetical protein [Tanacetum cinerariifolium]
MGDTTGQTRFKSVSKHSNDLLLARVNTLQSDEDRTKLNELMVLYTNLQTRFLELEKTKTSQGGEEVFVVEQEVVKDVNENVVEEMVNATQESTATTTITTEELALAQARKALKTSKPKVKGILIHEQEEPSKLTTTATISKQLSQDKGKRIMIEEPVKPQNKDQIRLDKEAAKRLQDKFDEEEILAR